MTLIDMTQKILSLLPPDHPWGQQIIHLKTIDSTNTYAKKLAQQGFPNGTVIIADEQTAGRGRMGRNFSSPAGSGLYMSVILRPDCSPLELMHLTCAVGVAASDAVFTASGLLPGIKWTNDLVVGKRKLGGILTELSLIPGKNLIDYAIVGIGINCTQQEKDFPPEIQGIATSLRSCRHATDTAALAAAVIDSLSQMDLLPNKAKIMQTFAERCVTIGQEISILRGDHVQHARATGIDANGGLLVQFPDGNMLTIFSGEVSIRGMYGYL